MGTLNLGTGSLNLTGSISPTQINTNNIRHSDGVTRHTPVSMTNKGASTILSSITWSSSTNSTTQDIGDLTSYTTSNTYAVSILHYYVHGGSTTHGYLQGYVHQKGKSYSAYGTYTSQQHYDWYYNVTTSMLTVPWDPDGDQTLSFYVSNAYNTSTSNYHAFFMNGIYEKVL